MVSDGKNIMIMNKEVLQLVLMLRYFEDNCMEFFQAEREDDMIVRDWVNRWTDAIMKSKLDPFKNIDL